MNIETAKNLFLWCTILNYGVLLIWCLAFRLGHDWHYQLTTHWFRTLSIETYDNVNFAGIALYKLAIILLNLVPYAALCIVGRYSG